MQTFVPYADFKQTASTLDMRRLGKQRVETFQVIGGLMRAKLITRDQVGTRMARRQFMLNDEKCWRLEEVPVYLDRPESDWEVVPRETSNGRTWGDHVIGKMWLGHEYALMQYQIDVCDTWTARGGKNDTCKRKTEALLRAKMYQTKQNTSMPDWVGRNDVHSSHRAALLWKQYDYYKQFGWDEEPKYDYVWPV